MQQCKPSGMTWSPWFCESYTLSNTSTYLDEHCKVYNYKCSSNEQIFPWKEVHWEQERKREAAGSSKTTVGNNELVFHSEGIRSELVTDIEESKYA